MSLNNLAKRPDGTSKISWAALEFVFPKASTYGEGVEISTTIGYGRPDGRRIVQRVRLKEMRMMVLIGVNDDERNQKQPVIVNFDLIMPNASTDTVDVSSLYCKLFGIEEKLAKVRAKSQLIITGQY